MGTLAEEVARAPRCAECLGRVGPEGVCRRCRPEELANTRRARLEECERAADAAEAAEAAARGEAARAREAADVAACREIEERERLAVAERRRRRRRLLALTLRHPWPWAIAALGKRIENRRWLPPLRKGAWFALHGGSPPRKPGERLRTLDLAARLAHRFDFAAPTEAEVFGWAGVFAACRYGGAVHASEDPWFEGGLGWRLDELVVLAEPIAYPGCHGLWELPVPIADTVREVIETGRGGSDGR